ncbi:hypothetical protein [Draconibacterium sediminis]|uniref:hypothetical protein n=1 Tax=Draconibacterium sediminis TaxID=1544798 RepID=UPI0026E976CC|nr:hypothetical protein [Draconibacterium sediminis]
MRLVIFFCICFIYSSSCAQNGIIDSTRKAYDELYGLDVLLHNGQTEFPYYIGHHGHPFWRSEKPFEADLVINGKKFSKQLLNYNIEKQDFILTYTDYNGGVKRLVLNVSAIDSVYTDNLIFVPAHNKDILPRFVQLIYDNRIKCFKGWRKVLKVANNVQSASGFQYNKTHTDFYLYDGVTITKFYNRKSFLQCFEKPDHPEIKKYITKHSIRFKDLSDVDLQNLLAFCAKFNP